MTRDLTASMQAEVVKPVLYPVAFLEGLYESGPFRLWTGPGTISWDGKEWTGAGNLLSLSEVTESQELKAIGVTATLAGLNDAILSLALQEDYQGRPCRIWLGALDESGQVIAEPYQIFGGTADVMQINEGGDQSSISMAAESRLIDLERARQHRYEHEAQQAFYPGDLGLQYVSSIQDTVILWGRS
ncbi:MAG: hypothetical protein KG075_22185 [Alphaproteobacteria bacterium]|nr:hypothetical protein [Alphaproteobacteria bacterium]